MKKILILLLLCAVGIATAFQPEGFKSSMLAENGVAKAQLVVGANAPGPVEDLESAEVIKNAVADKLKVEGFVGDIEFKYFDEDLDDDGNSSNNNFTSVDSGNGSAVSDLGGSFYITNVTDTYMGIAGALRYDANEDKDLKDSKDYVLYTGAYILDSSALRLAYYLTNITDLFGTRINIKGTWMLVTDASTGDKYIKICPAVYKNLASMASFDKDSATALVSNIKLELVGSGAGARTLYILNGDTLEGSVDLSQGNENGGPARAHTSGGEQYGGSISMNKLNSRVHDASDVLDDYNIFITRGNETSTSVEISISRDSECVTVHNKKTGILGYSIAYVADAELVGGSDSDALFLMSESISLSKGTAKDITGTYFNLKLDTNGNLNIRRADTTTVSSGTWIDKDFEEYSPFLGEDIFVTVERRETRIPRLDIKDEESANKDMNLVLIGGPVANSLTEELVKNKKSGIDWNKSIGDIEVIQDAYARGKYAIIVAGKDRNATRLAADALVDFL